MNEEEYLENILGDLLKQTYNHSLIDVILIDSLSTDNTLEIMREFKRKQNFRNTIILSNENKRLAYGWNLGIKTLKQIWF